MDDKQVVQCPRCGFPNRVDSAKLQIMNGMFCSMIVWGNKISYECANCKVQFTGAITGFDPRAIRFEFVEVPKAEQSLVLSPDKLTRLS